MGAETVQQCLRAGLLDEIDIRLIAVLLGGGVRLFDHLGEDSEELDCVRVVNAPGGHAPELPRRQLAPSVQHMRTDRRQSRYGREISNVARHDTKENSQ